MSCVVVYSTGCPKCNVLKNKLISKHIQFTEITDIEVMKGLGLKSAPWLSVDDQMMDFGEAVKWANAQEVVA